MLEKRAECPTIHSRGFVDVYANKFGKAGPLVSSRLRIMETTDLHMQLDAFDYLRDATGQRYGLAGLEPVIANARAEGIETVLCDNGDFLQGNPLADLLAADTSGAIHPIIGAFNALNYDVITLGNHEFNYGLKRLLEVLNHAEAHVVSANLRTSPRTLLINPWTIITRQLHCSDGSVRPIRVGVIGFVMPKVEKWDCIDPSEPIFSDDVVEAARTALPSLKRAKADIIVALCHSGIGSAQHVNGMENAAIPLSAIPEIDVLLTGHTHDVFPDPDFAHLAEADTIKGTLNGTPTVMAGSYGSHLGLIVKQHGRIFRKLWHDLRPR